VPKKTRNRQLARLHQQRHAERLQRQRKRQLATIAVAVVIALVGGLAAFAAFSGGDETPVGASGEGRQTESPSPSGPHNQTSTVQPEPGPREVACGAKKPKDALTPKPQFSAPEQVLEPNATYTAEVQTSCGTIVIELLADRAPATVNSFVFLAQQGYFDGQRFHRLDTSIDVIQGGDPTGTGSGGPGYSIPDELTGDESYGPGVLAMANAGANTGGSQFFLITGEKGHNLDDNPAYTIFGRVIEGLGIAKTIQNLPIQDPEAAAAGDLSGQQPAQSVYIEKVTIRQGS
jgi:cyclophilin family peptidyl-prolyl cis-trans isomerase